MILVRKCGGRVVVLKVQLAQNPGSKLSESIYHLNLTGSASGL